MNVSERAPYLEAADAMLVPEGFQRKKKEFEWRRVVELDTEWIHLNFGLGVINPSYGVRFADVDALFPADLGVRCGQHRMLQSLTGTSYSKGATSPLVVANDLVRATGEFSRLRERKAFIEQLESEELSRRFGILFSNRIRILPAMLASLGRWKEALGWVVRFESVAFGRDQISPSYEVFAAHFRTMKALRNI